MAFGGRDKLAQKLVLPVKSSVNCDAAAHRKRSIGPAAGI